ncbi:MAG TPA: phosphoribosylamine--glycine ligase [Bacteroidota bacterium]|nr:phosphoribosylamine--glycine ligase [Bacteroidota bacterium]
MNVLVIGSGGREHALAWKLKQSPRVTKLFCAPGNPGITSVAECVPIESDDLDALYHFARTQKIDLTVVGPEVPLVKGIVDLFEAGGLPIFGPSKAAAALEGSKVFAKHFMKRYGIPTARYETFDRSRKEEARRYILAHPAPVVLKADGLAAGKGAVVCRSTSEALGVLDDMFSGVAIGEAGSSIVVEEFMTGEEASIFVFTDGTQYGLLEPAQDHKQIFDGDKGKNTGGMGAFAPARVASADVIRRVEKEIIEPVLAGMRNEGRPYRGCLYVGIMLTPEGPKVVEFNCRLGDPEAQVVLPLIDGDLAEILSACASRTAHTIAIRSHDAAAVCVVLASGGYPDAYVKGKEIHGLETINPEDGVIVFHAGTKSANGAIVTSGGRVLGVTAIGYGHELEETIRSAYAAVKKITFDGAYYRSDIGRKGLLHH